MPYRKGFSLIEILVTVALSATLVTILSASLLGVRLTKHSQFQAEAYSLAKEGIEAVRSLPFDALTNRQNAHLAGVFHNQGAWGVASSTQAPSAPNVFSLTKESSPIEEITGLAALPGGTYNDFTLETKIKINPMSPSGWKGGIVFRASDLDNHYRLLIQSDGQVSLEKLENGSKNILYSKNKNISGDTWYTLKVIADGAALGLYLNEALLQNITDPSFSNGIAGLISMGSALTLYDNVSVTASLGTNTWNFDADSLGEVPEEWKRFGVYDMPAGQGYLTVLDYEDDTTNLKRITVRITWIENQETKEVRLVTLRSK